MKHRPLVALSSAAVLAVYAAGYVRTRAAADRFAAEAAPRRAPAATPPLVQAPPPLPSIQPGEPVIAPPTERVRTRARAAAREAATEAEVPAAPIVEPVPITAAPPPAPAPEAQFKDGTYLGWGYCRHGDIQASVVIEGGRITSATVARCLTRYSCSWIEPIYPQVVSRQSPEVDYVSGATESTDAFHDAVADALSKAK
ncbi:MAG: hypothetical protein DMF87_11820 [Acidobacteria bacterium]|nr:MAG: hypothetical protein DMF88_00125 [Acidobacteriota bacterium]PYR79230.1 MAG: hypothetical protein DMF87_11820 [Acidobacteriota bacterium]